MMSDMFTRNKQEILKALSKGWMIIIKADF